MSLYKMSLFKQCIVILAMAVMAGFAGCGDNNEPAPENQGEEQTENSTDLDTDEPEIVDGTKCSELGMIPNDETQGANNRKILINALNDGTNILVDNKYYLTGTGNSTLVDKDIVIVGVTDNAEFTFTKTTMTQSNFIKVECQNLFMRKVKFTSMKGEPVYAFMPSGAHKMKIFAFEKCYFEGPIRLISWGFGGNFLDPDLVDFGIDRFKFTDNICRNNNKSLLILNDVIIKHAQILRNDIKNFSQILYTNAVSPGNDSMMRKYSPKMEYLEVKNNKVINDDLWDGNELGANYVPTYHCFIFFEGNKCEYMNNHIEGLHMIDQHTVVYDSYLSCFDLVYENNFWKNNILFETDENVLTGRQLMKSKGGAYVDGSYKHLKRVYRNNEYIIEKSYATRFSRNPDELWVRIIEFDNDMQSVVVENNKIDVYCIRLNSANVKTHNYTFSDNTIHAVKTYNKKYNSVMSISVVTNDGIAGNFIARNNNITIDESGSVPIEGNYFINYSITDRVVKHFKVILENNTVKWPDMQAVVRSGTTVQSTDMDITMKNNNITTKAALSNKAGWINGAGIDLTGNTFTVTGGI